MPFTGYWPWNLVVVGGPFVRAAGLRVPFGFRTGFLRGRRGSAALGLLIYRGGPPFGVGPFD